VLPAACCDRAPGVGHSQRRHLLPHRSATPSASSRRAVGVEPSSVVVERRCRSMPSGHASMRWHLNTDANDIPTASA
jgi:hypothetical protein